MKMMSDNHLTAEEINKKFDELEEQNTEVTKASEDRLKQAIDRLAFPMIGLICVHIVSIVTVIALLFNK